VAVLEKIGDVVVRPAAEIGTNVAAQVWGVPSVEQRSGEAPRSRVVERLFLPSEAARGVARTAMTEALHQIGAAIPMSLERVGCLLGESDFTFARKR
jgi:hypothetical protein